MRTSIGLDQPLAVILAGNDAAGDDQEPGKRDGLRRA